MENKVTVKDVAREAGVSVATVSYVMNQTPGQKISEETRKKVLQIANLLNYRPSHAAKSLASGHNNIVGVAYFLDPATPSRNLDITAFVNLLIERLNRLHYDVLFMPIKAVEDKLPINRNIDGIIAIDLTMEQFHNLADNYLVPIINVDMLVKDGLFFQIYTNLAERIRNAAKDFGSDYYVILDRFSNENYNSFAVSGFDSDRVLFFDQLNQEKMEALSDKKAVIIGNYLALIVHPYLKEENMVVISTTENANILPDKVKFIFEDTTPKANLAINILMNAMDRKFAIAHDNML